MPYRWDRTEQGERLTLWPHRSLGARGFVIFISLTALALSLPLIALLGTAILWVLLPFLGATLGGLWLGLRRNYHDGSLREELTLTVDEIGITRTDPKGQVQSWSANPHWVQLRLTEAGGPVEDYLTLRGNGREVELGAFLSPGERQALYRDLGDRLARSLSAGEPPRAH